VYDRVQCCVRMNIIVLNSGSNGNAVYVESRSGTAVLLDCGISARRIEERLAVHGRSARQVCGIFVTHEHTDHVRGIATLATKHHHSIHLSPGTHRAMRRSYPSQRYHGMEPGEATTVGDIMVRAHPKSHDAAEPVFFEVIADDRMFLYITDLGFADDVVHRLVPRCDALLLESNHDVDMLKNGSYPEHLQRRILSDVGHLSNTQCMDVLAASGHAALQHLILGHLSKHNNSPDIVIAELHAVLRASPHITPQVTIASRDEASRLLSVE
jgi:phosphoribosyl 1,2-cyclic phosphodiesterase